jgi:hypothetical protein
MDGISEILPAWFWRWIDGFSHAWYAYGLDRLSKGPDHLAQARARSPAARPGSVLLLREEAGRIVLDPAAVTPVALYAGEEIERLVEADRANPGERAALRRRWGLKPSARRRGRG